MIEVLRSLNNSSLRHAFTISKSFSKRSIQKIRFTTGGKKFYSEDGTRNIVSSPLGEIKIPNLLFHELIYQHWSLWERKCAIVCGETGRKYSYKNIFYNAKALGATFQNKLHLTKGDVIAVVLYNCPEYPVVFLAASRCGVVPTTINPSSNAGEIKWQLKDSGAKVIVTHSVVYNKCLAIVQAMKVSFPILVVKSTPDAVIPEESIDLHELFDPTISGSPRPVDISPDDTLALLYSCGTTAFPKGVVLTHRSVVSNLMQLSHPESMIIAPTTRFHQDTIFGVLPMFHIYGLIIGTFFSLINGCRLVTLPKFSRHLFLRNLFKKKVAVLYLVPSILCWLSIKTIPPKFFRHLSYVISAGSSMPVPQAYTILEKADHLKLVQAYGMTESSPALTHSSSRRMQKLQSIGVPIASTKLKVVNSDTGRALSHKEIGELCAWGPQLMKGYWNRPKETAAAFDKDGWLRTGDIAYYDEHGDFFLVERAKDMIKVKGFQVAPGELEEGLRAHPKIKDAVVVGIPHDTLTEVPKAFIILEDDAHMTEEEVRRFVRQKFSQHKQLKGGVVFVDHFPRNTVGKIIRKQLKEMF